MRMRSISLILIVSGKILIDINVKIVLRFRPLFFVLFFSYIYSTAIVRFYELVKIGDKESCQFPRRSLEPPATKRSGQSKRNHVFR